MTYNPNAPENFEHVSSDSETVPDQTPDLKTMITKGVATHVRDDGYSDDDYPDIEFMDKTEIEIARLENLQTIEDLKQRQHAYNRFLEQKKQQALDEAAQAAEESAVKADADKKETTK